MSQILGQQREYETLLVLNPELTDDQATQAVDRLKEVLDKKEATLLREEKWGKKRLAFDVKKSPRGNFFLLHYVGQVGVVEELERICRNIDPVIRFLTTVNGDVKDLEAKKAEVEKMVAKRAAEREKAEAEARAAEEARRAREQEQQEQQEGEAQAAEG